MTAQTAWAQEIELQSSDGDVTLEGGEYIVDGNVDISGDITANNPVNLTISNGATLSVRGHIEGGNITIDVQGGSFIGQTCTINVRNSQNATIKAADVIILDGTTITNSTIVSNVILAYGGTFSGSNVTVNSYLQLLGEVVFDASSPAVSIKVEEYDNDYGGTLTISNGSLKDDDGNIYEEGPVDNPSVLNGKTLTYYNASSAITVSLNAQGGSGGTESVTPTAGDPMPDITPPTRTGYTFGGYYIDQGCTGTQYYDDKGKSTHVCDLTGTVTLYAKWTANTYTVTFDRQGGSGGQESVTATFGSVMPAITPPTRTDCEFVGYYTETNGGGTKYYNADGSSARTWGIDDNTTLYAYWKKYLNNTDITIEIPAQTYSGSQLTPVVTVKDNGIEVSDAHYNIILPEGRTNAGDYTINIEAKEGSTAYVRATYATFTISPKALTVTANPKTITYGDAPANDGVTYSGFVNGEDESVLGGTLGYDYDYAQNDPVGTYTITPDGLTATNYDITFANGTLTVNKAASSVTAAPTAQSLVFDGFEQTLINAGTASGGTMNYSLDNSTWSTALPTAIEAGEYTVYYKVVGDGNHNNTDAASIKAYIDYTIDYDLDGGSVASANPTRYNVTTATFTLTNPTRTGYDFAGWTGTGLTDATETVTIAQGSTGNRSYMATWTPMRFDVEGFNGITFEWTSVSTVKVFKYNGTAVEPIIPESVDHNGVSYTVTEIGKGAFMGNTDLVSMNLNTDMNPITTIGARAFKNCLSLSDFHFPPCLTSIDSEAFSGCALEEITIPNCVTTIGAKAFADCTNLTSVTIPEGVTELSDDVFENCNANLIIYVPEDLVDSYSDKWPAYTIVPVGAIPYIAADGSKAYRTDYTVLTGNETSLGTAGVETWYVVNSISDINYNHPITLNGGVNLILCDGITMTVDGGSCDAIGGSGSSLTIYGQKTGTGKLITQCGEGYGISSSAITINGGIVNATGSPYDNYSDIYASGNVTINGGKVSANYNSNGIKADGNIILGWINITTDRIYAKSYIAGGTVSIASGKAFTDGTNVYNSATPSATLVALTNVTLIPKKDFTQCTATVPDQTLGRFNPATNSYYKTSKISYLFSDCRTLIGEEVKDGETILTLGTDYEFGSISYASPDTRDYWDVDKDKTGDVCQVEIIGKGDYAGTKTATFTIVDPSGTWGDANELTWSLTDGALSITGTGAMETADNYGKYPWAEYCSDVTSITIDEGVTSVAPYAFGRHYDNQTNSYSNVETVTLPSTLKSIGDQAFKGCTGDDFKSIVIPASVTSIGADAFYGCTGVTDVYCYADPTKLTWGDTGDDFKSGKATKCHVADASAWSSFSGVNVTFVGDLASASIPYIDADGNTAYCTDFTVIDGSEDSYNAAGWYVVKGEVSKEDDGIKIFNEAHIILAGDATLTLSNGSFDVFSHLTIYGQTKGNGTLNVTKTDGDGICTHSSGNLTINGGIINATGGNGLVVAGNLVINGGTVTGTTKNDDYSLYYSLLVYGTITINGGQVTANGVIYSKGDLTINGGQVTATRMIATNDGNITLGWTSGTDYIKAGKILTGLDTYTVSIANGKAFTDGTSAYTSVTPSATLEALKNKTLQPITGVTVTKDGSGELTATLDGSSLTTLSIPADVEVDAVNFGREFTEGTAVTLMLPFSLAAGQTITGGTLYKFSGIEKNSSGKWIATMTQSATLKANTPYLLMPNDELSSGNNGTLTFGLNSAPVTLNSTTAGESSVTTEVSSDWEFKGSYEERHWYDGTDGVHAASNADEIGKVYGFAAYSGKATDGVTDIDAGQFVRLASGAWLRPSRCYLLYKGTGNPMAGARNKRAANDELPDKITVRLIGLNGSTTAIGTLDTKTGELRFDDSWFSLDGTKLDGKPTKPGLYINNGKKVLVP